MKRKVLIATTNPAKFLEIKTILGDLPFEFVSLRDVGITKEVEENGRTYEENAQKKALQYSKHSGLPAVSDDGGLEIDALGGLPGVDSKYFAGKEGKDEDIINKMIQVARDLPGDNRKAKFVAVLSFALPNGKVWSKRAQTGLLIAKNPLLKFIKGFPYRSFLIIPQLNKFYHDEQLTLQEQKKYGHRYKALMKLKKIIKEHARVL